MTHALKVPEHKGRREQAGLLLQFSLMRCVAGGRNSRKLAAATNFVTTTTVDANHEFSSNAAALYRATTEERIKGGVSCSLIKIKTFYVEAAC